MASAVAAPEITIEQPAGNPLATGTVTAWGRNNYGQTNTPIGLIGVKAIAAGNSHNVAIKGDGTVVAWGFSLFGQTAVPAGLTSVQSVAAGYGHTVAVKGDGSLVAWGDNGRGQTTIPAGLTAVQAVGAGDAHTVALRNDGTVVAWGENFFGKITIPAGLTGVQAIAVGPQFNLSLKSDGTVVGWGLNNYGQTSVPVGLTGVQAIAAGGNHSVALTTNGTVVFWGSNFYGETTLPVGLTRIEAIAAGGAHTVALTSDGNVVAWGENSYGQTSVPAGLTGVRAIAAGGYHTLAVVDSNVEFGNQPIGTTSAAKTFIIRNTGDAALNITGVSVVGGNASDFIINTEGMLTSIPAGSQTTFGVAFTPGALGDRRTTLRLLNNDTDEGTFNIMLSGGVAFKPEIAVFNGASTNTVDERADNTGTNVFGGAYIGSGTVQTFTIKNTGSTNLVGLAVTKTGPNADEFTIGTLGAITLAPDTTTTFTVTFSPTAGGVRRTVIAIANNDWDENPFEINLSGIGFTPEIIIEQPAGTPLTTSRVRAWGWGGGGQTNVPSGLKGVQAVAAGGTFSVALKNDGTVVAWGFNGTTVPADLTDVQAIAAGQGHTVALKSDGTGVAWGSNNYGQTNVPSELTGVQAIAAGDLHTVALKSDGTVVAWGRNLEGQADIPVGLASVQAIAAGILHTAALKSDGTVVVWGSNGSGQTNVPSGLTSVRAIAAGGSHTVALKSDGTVVAWGSNGYGQTSVPSGLTGVEAIAAGSGHTVVLKHGGAVVAWGKNDFGQATAPAGLMGVKTIASENNHNVGIVVSTIGFGNRPVGTTSATKTFIIKNSGGSPLNITDIRAIEGDTSDFTVSTTGMLTSVPPDSQTTFTATFTPGTVGVRALTLRLLSNDIDDGIFDIMLTGTGVIAPDIAVFTGASTSQVDERADNTGTNIFANTIVGSGADVQTFTIKNTGNIDLTGLVLTKTGANLDDFILGTLDATSLASNAMTSFTVTFTPTKPGARSAVVAIASNDGDENPFEINVSGFGTTPEISIEQPVGTPLLKGPIVAWGRNDFGQTTAPIALTAIQAISAGFGHTVALKSDGTVVAWGQNLYGQATVPVGLTGIQSIAAGGYHTLALKSDRAVVAWGINGDGQTSVPVGLTDVQGIAAGRNHSVVLKSDGTVVAWGYNGFGQTNVPVGLTDVHAIAAGLYHTLAIKADGTVVAWGNNLYGQTSVPSGLSGVQAIAGGYFHTVALKSDGTVVAWGLNNYGQTSVPVGLTGVQAVAAGEHHSVALKSNGTVVVWGDNTYGQTNVPGGLANVRAIAAGYSHTVVLTDPAAGFGNQYIGNTSPAKTFTINNSGDATLSITNVSLIGVNASDFTVSTTGMLPTVPVGSQTTFTVTFTPGAAGARTTTLRVLNNDIDEGTFDIVLTGTGVLPGSPTVDGSSLTMLSDGGFQFSFTPPDNVIFSVIASTNLGLPLADWTVVGTATNIGGDLYQFGSPTADFPFRFYRLRFP